ncbi:phosphatidate cytidylyltransferase [Pseudanabaena sp. FACHB-1998]|uniref:diacylglycerol/polyprenol kinase family protein n=1 Tax=Pseudanabaena sp. FACHB-1998 TaxID=2692858 RepID=UPI00168069E4|nr:diacylglycerol/polyprenol kinase family protein [Pseudanabaena sp. FACHB-1998]MBD2178946.1 phosphatidate cytidylyltransferase [Pseudanabaena sp. FACHB-1998]
MPITSDIAPTTNIAFQVCAVAIWLGLVFLTSEILHRFKQDPELVRKVVHIGTGNVLLIAWWLQIPTWLCIAAGVIFSAIALASHLINILPMLNDVGRKTYGVFYYALSITILVTLLWENHPQYAVIGVMVMSWGDGMAALIGKRFGKHTFVNRGNKRSYEGSLAMFTTSLVVILGIFGINKGISPSDFGVAVPVAAIAALLEAYSPGGTDNLSVPLSSAFLSLALQSL